MGLPLPFRSFRSAKRHRSKKRGLRDKKDGGTKSISENCPPPPAECGQKERKKLEAAKGRKDTTRVCPLHLFFFVPPATTPPVGIFTNSFFSRQKLPQRQQNQSLQPGATLKLHGLFASARMVRAKCQRVRFGERDDGAAVAVSARCKKALFFSLLFFGKQPSPPSSNCRAAGKTSSAIFAGNRRFIQHPPLPPSLSRRSLPSITRPKSNRADTLVAFFHGRRIFFLRWRIWIWQTEVRVSSSSSSLLIFRPRKGIFSL